MMDFLKKLAKTVAAQRLHGCIFFINTRKRSVVQMPPTPLKVAVL